MGKSYVEEVQLMQLKSTIPSRTANLIGLVDITTMEDFWTLMDEEYLDYNQLSRGAIADIKGLDRKDPRFLQMMLVKLTTHRKNLELSGMGHRITSDEMVREEWLPMLTDAAKEDWLKVPVRSSPIWNHFEKFLQEQSQACKERERLGLIQSSHKTGKKECSRCKATGHTQETCTAQFCISCRSWRCKNRDHKNQNNYEEKKSYCKLCDDDHPYGKHTQRFERQRNDIATGQKSHMQSASKCSRCNREVRDTLVTCGA